MEPACDGKAGRVFQSLDAVVRGEEDDAWSLRDWAEVFYAADGHDSRSVVRSRFTEWLRRKARLLLFAVWEHDGSVVPFLKDNVAGR